MRYLAGCKTVWMRRQQIRDCGVRIAECGMIREWGVGSVSRRLVGYHSKPRRHEGHEGVTKYLCDSFVFFVSSWFKPFSSFILHPCRYTPTAVPLITDH